MFAHKPYFTYCIPKWDTKALSNEWSEFSSSQWQEHHQLRFSPPQIELVGKTRRESVPGVQRGYFKKIVLVGGKIKPNVVYNHENLDGPNRCFVRLCKLYMSLCPADHPADTIYLMPLQNLSALQVGWNTMIQNQSFSPGHCCDMIQGLTNSWSWRLLDTAVRKVFVLSTKGHLKPSVKQFRTSLVQRGSVFNTPSLPNTSIL